MSDQSTERTTVRAYVPAYQRDEWDEHAEQLDMSRSEFVRTMVQAGRRMFDAEVTEPAGGPTGAENRDERELEHRVIEALEATEFLAWDELVAELTADLEDRLEETLEELQSANRVRYSGPNGGYTLEHEH